MADGEKLALTLSFILLPSSDYRGVIYVIG
jgi:hypothetical protein